MNMVEIVARAIWKTNRGIEWEFGERADQLDCLAEAREAIKALRRPTDGMKEAGYTPHAFLTPSDIPDRRRYNPIRFIAPCSTRLWQNEVEMKVTSFTKAALTSRREIKEMEAAGYEHVGDNGGKLWELNRGGRWRQVITDVKIASDGKSLWVKIGDPA